MPKLKRMKPIELQPRINSMIRMLSILFAMMMYPKGLMHLGYAKTSEYKET